MKINAVFEGGGIKGLSYIGALSFLEERGIKIYKAGGTSVGALFASLVIAGFKSSEIMNIVNSFDVGILKPNNISYIKAIKNRGLYTINNLEEFIDNLLTQKGKRYFKDVKYGNDYLLKIIATDITNKRMVIIPNDLPKYGIDPDNFKIASAVAMSSSLPFVYKPYKLNKQIFFDGGIVSNFPMEYLGFEKDNLLTIGFRFASKNNKSYENIKNKFFNLNKTSNITKQHIVYINCLNIKTTEFQKGLLFKNNLYNEGYNATKEFFYNNFFRKCFT